MKNATSLFEILLAPEFTTVRFYDFIDASAVQGMRPEIDMRIPAGCKNIIIDLEHVNFVDSHGIGLFVSLMKRVHQSRGRLVIAGAQAQPSAVLQMVGFNDNLVTYCKTYKNAAALFRPGLEAAG